jgi:cell division protein FtsL
MVMSRINLLLLAALLVSSLWLVRTSYEARHLFGELDRARGVQQRLDAEHRRLDAERQTQATNLRVERVARDKLGMRPALPGMTIAITDPGPGTGPATGAIASGAAR